MNLGDKLELGIVAFIVVGFAIAIWKGGAANPISTGRLQRDLAAIKGDVAKLKESSKGTVKAADLGHLRQDMEKTQNERTQAMAQLEAKIEKVGDEVDALQKECAGRLATVEATTTATAHQVDLLYQHIVAKGMS